MLIVPKPDMGTDEKCALLAQGGNPEAVLQLVVRFTPLAARLARQARRGGLEFDDLLQEGMIALFAAVMSFDPLAGASLRTYMTQCIQNRLTSVLRSHMREKNRLMYNHAPLPDDASDPRQAPAELSDPQDIYIRKEKQMQLGLRIRELLSDFERDVLSRFLEGSSYREIAQSLGCTTKAVDNALQRVRRKLHVADRATPQ